MRADAKKNYSHILEVARGVVAEQGLDISMRDIARRADVGLATLLRHFPSLEALFEALACTDLEAMTLKASELETSDFPGQALESWVRDWVAFAQGHRGVVNLMAAAHTNPQSALYAACGSVHSASARLLARAQSDGSARTDMNGDDLFALLTALGWAIDQPSFAPRTDQLVRLITDVVLADRRNAEDARV